jgi:hypothetical protein
LRRRGCPKNRQLSLKRRPNEMIDNMSGIINLAKERIEKALKNKEAFDETTAVDAEEEQVNFRSVLDLMERSGLIGRTAEGKIFMTKKGLQKQTKN